MPSIDSKLIGSHAVLLTGYNSKTRLFDIKNSWGNDWGFKGFAFLPYSYVELYASEVIAVENEF